MLVVFIHALEIALVALLATLAYRMHSLYQAEGYAQAQTSRSIIKHLIQGKPASNQEYEQKMESLKRAQTFSGIQLLEIKRSYGNLSQENLAWLREAISLYLIGAIDLIGKDARCSTPNRKELVLLVLKSNLNLNSETALNYYREALYRKLSSDNDLMVRAGAKAAKSWLSYNKIPTEVSLHAQLDEWGIFA